MKTLFSDLKVVELANVLAGPSVGMFFAELGATVFKVENKNTGGDVTRSWKLPTEDRQAPVSAYYAAINWGKQVIHLDLTTESDREKVYTLVAEADIIITNFISRDAIKLGMTYGDFSEKNPAIIQGNITAYGENDERKGYDLIIQAEAGFMSMNGAPESGPLKMPVALIDVLAAHQLKEALLLALIQKMRTGKGGYVAVSLFESAIASLANQASNYLTGAYIPGLMGSLHPNIAPYGEILLTADGKKIVLAIGSDSQFGKLCGILGRPELAKDPSFETNGGRLQHRARLSAMLEACVREMESADLLTSFVNHGIPAGVIRNLAEVFNDPLSKKRILEEMREGHLLRCVSTLAFEGIE